MKKVLFATTALVMTAGVASAEVAVSGNARMGMIYDGNDVQFSSRTRVVFTLSGESDAGLSFGGEFRADNATGAKNGVAGNVWISGTYGKLAMGDTVSASEAAIGDLYEVGYTQGGFGYDVEEFNYLTGDGENTDQGPNILYTYTIDRFSLFASASDGSDTAWPTTVGADVDDVDGNPDSDAQSDQAAWSVAAKYDAGNWWVSLGYAKHDDAEEIGLGGGATFNQFTVKGAYFDYSDRYEITVDSLDGNFGDFVFELGNYYVDKSFGLSAEYAMDAITVGGFWRRDEFKSDVAGDDDKEADSFGIGAEYDLGGGATLAGGIIDTDYLDDTVADFGIRFTF